MIHTFYRLGRLYATSLMLVLMAIACAIAVVGLSLTVPWILKEVLDYGLAQRQMRFLYLAGALLVAVTIVRGVVAYGQSYLTAHLAQHLAYRLRHLLYDQMQRSSFAYHDRAQTGDLMSRATADVEAVRMFFQFGWPIGLSVALTGAGTMLAMAWLDWRLLGLALGSLPFFLGVILGIGQMLRPLQVWVQEKTGDLTVALQESLAGIRVVKAFARERQQAESFAKCNGCASIIHTELAIDMFCMQFDCFGCDNQFACNLLVCEVCIEHMQNLQFTPGQWFQTLFHQEIFLRTSLYRYWIYRLQDDL